MKRRQDNAYMFIIDCPICGADNTTATSQQLVSNTHIQSISRTSDGLVGHVRCAGGHTVIHRFADQAPTPKPPASVTELVPRWQHPAAAA